jgi:hypothetical protein
MAVYWSNWRKLFSSENDFINNQDAPHMYILYLVTKAVGTWKLGLWIFSAKKPIGRWEK